MWIAYQTFYKSLTAKHELTVKIGRGGLSFYKQITDEGSVFVSHFNAAPRRGVTNLGFADFRLEAVRPYLNLETTLRALQKAAPPEIEFKVNKLWCSLHFPLTRTATVADLFSKYIVSKVR